MGMIAIEMVHRGAKAYQANSEVRTTGDLGEPNHHGMNFMDAPTRGCSTGGVEQVEGGQTHGDDEPPRCCG
jgi:hypothetical protein